MLRAPTKGKSSIYNKKKTIPSPLNDDQICHNPTWLSSSGIQRYLPAMSRIVCAALKGHAAIVHQQRQITEGVSKDEKQPNVRRSTFSKAPLRLEAGACVIPHDAKMSTGGEDAFFATKDRRIMGVADGVSSMAMYGIDPKLFPTRLMEQSCAHAERFCSSPDTPWTEQPATIATEVMRYGYGQVLQKEINGASTAVVVSLDAHKQQLGFCSLGDSAVIVLRKEAGVGYNVVAKSNDLQHRFNCPYQLSFMEGQVGDSVDSSHISTVDVEEGDLVVLGTDGILDNVSCEEIAAIVSRALAPSEAVFLKRHAQKLAPLCEQATLSAAPATPTGDSESSNTDKPATDVSSPQTSDDSLPKFKPETLAALMSVESTSPHVLAEALAKFAYFRSKRKDIFTPFEDRCMKEGLPWRGGKPDDITVVVGWVVGSRTPPSASNNTPLVPPTMTGNVNPTVAASANVLRSIQAARQLQTGKVRPSLQSQKAVGTAQPVQPTPSDSPSSGVDEEDFNAPAADSPEVQASKSNEDSCVTSSTVDQASSSATGLRSRAATSNDHALSSESEESPRRRPAPISVDHTRALSAVDSSSLDSPGSQAEESALDDGFVLQKIAQASSDAAQSDPAEASPRRAPRGASLPGQSDRASSHGGDDESMITSPVREGDVGFRPPSSSSSESDETSPQFARLMMEGEALAAEDPAFADDVSLAEDSKLFVHATGRSQSGEWDNTSSCSHGSRASKHQEISAVNAQSPAQGPSKEPLESSPAGHCRTRSEDAAVFESLNSGEEADTSITPSAE